jgi:hypothetical protein
MRPSFQSWTIMRAAACTTGRTGRLLERPARTPRPAARQDWQGQAAPRGAPNLQVCRATLLQLSA